jgi:NAD-dependent dihydropyrimidine dehydrogenase PreA subunit
MGHLGMGLGVYGKLQKRLDKFPIGAPSAKELYEILRILFSEEEAFVASRMPIKFSGIKKISTLTQKSEKELLPLLDRMAEKGLVMDFERRGKTYYILSPTLLGFFEFTYMRVRDDIPQKRLAHLMWNYAHENRETVSRIFSGETEPGRALVYEDTLSEEDGSQILTHEVASGLIREAKKIAVGLCYCRHIREHNGQKCKYPMDVCTSLNGGAEFVIRRGFMREVSKEEALDIFEKTRENGLVYVADNVKRRPSFICNCCGCCCGMLGAFKKFQLVNSVATSAYVAQVDEENCEGCGRCAKRCQVNLISMASENGQKRAVVNQELCLGCGVCASVCKNSAITMERRGERIITPESSMEKYLMMALEQGKLGNYIFDDLTSLPYAALRNMVNAISKIPPVKKYISSSGVKSRFLQRFTGR